MKKYYQIPQTESVVIQTRQSFVLSYNGTNQTETMAWDDEDDL